MNNENIYLADNLNIKTVFIAMAAFIDIVLCFTSLLILPLTLIDYSSAALGFFLCISVAFGILMVLRVKNLVLIAASKSYAKYFMEVNEPFVIIKKIPEATFNSGAGIMWHDKYKIKNLSLIDGAIRKGYLKNCTIEIHMGVPKIALSKKKVKDRCPTCGALITDVESDIYTCKYCRNTIKRVVVKK